MTQAYMSPDDLVVVVPNRRGGKSTYHRQDCTFARKAQTGEWSSLVREVALRRLAGLHRTNQPCGSCKPTDASTAVYVQNMRERHA